jgi:glycolate oxidase FAD binding subunit
VLAAEVFDPESPKAAAELLVSCQEKKLKLGFIGGGTALGLGNPARGIDAVVLTRRLDRVVEYAPEDQVIVVEAGITLGRLQTLARRNGQWLGVDAPHAELATLGGLVAVGGFGPRRARYGALRDLLLGVTLVRADGAIAHGGGKVVKNVAGFDLPKVVAGSLGTLGLITEVTLRLHPLPELSATYHSAELDATGVTQSVLALRQAQLEPSAVVAVRGPSGRYELGVRLEGFARGVERDGARLLDFARAPSAAPGAGPLWQRLDDSAELSFWQRAEAPRQSGSLRCRLTALPTDLPRLEPLVQALLGTLHAGHFAWYATLGIGFIAGDAGAPETVLPALQTARDALVAGGGSLTVDAAPSAVADAFDAWGPVPSAFAVMQQLKQRFDPEGRMNPHRFVGGI